MSDVKNVKKRKNGKRKRKKGIALILFVLFSLALLIGLSLTVFFPVKSIKATGSKFYEARDLVKYSGIEIGENLLRINENEVLANIQRSLPFVDDVSVEKNLDGNIILKVTDAKEVFSYSIDEKFYSTDKNDRVLKVYDEMPENMLHIICDAKLSEDKLSVELNDVKKEEIIEMISPKVEGFSLKANELDITNSYEITMLFDNRLKVNFGDVSYFEEKLSHFLKMCENENLYEVSGTVNLSQYTPENHAAYFIKDKNNVK